MITRRSEEGWRSPDVSLHEIADELNTMNGTLDRIATALETLARGKPYEDLPGPYGRPR